ncbi:MAG TPA: hypothetical protein VGK16_02215 [Candidatus Limnocylindrales bacterium]
MASASVAVTRGEMMERWIAVTLCAAIAVAWAAKQAAPNPQTGGPMFAPAWLPVVAAVVGVMAVLPVHGPPTLVRALQGLQWAALLLLLWSANGLPFDLLTAAGLIGRRTETGEIVMATVWWPTLATRALSMAAAVVLANRALAGTSPRSSAASRATGWFAYAAFVLALPYPLLRVRWALGGTIGLDKPGAAGEGFEPLLIAIPWILAAVLSLLLAEPRRWPGRRVLLGAGWLGVAIVAMIGPAAVWSFARAVLDGTATGSDGIAPWVFGLFYGSWLLWAIAAAAATRSYQLRTATVSQGRTSE